MTKTRGQVQPDWEAICISMEHIGDLSNDSIGPKSLKYIAYVRKSTEEADRQRRHYVLEIGTK